MQWRSHKNPWEDHVPLTGHPSLCGRELPCLGDQTPPRPSQAPSPMRTEALLFGNLRCVSPHLAVVSFIKLVNISVFLSAVSGCSRWIEPKLEMWEPPICNHRSEAQGTAWGLWPVSAVGGGGQPCRMESLTGGIWWRGDSVGMSWVLGHAAGVGELPGILFGRPPTHTHTH